MQEPYLNANMPEEEVEIDLRQIINVLKKWRNLIIAMTLLCGFAAGILSYFVMTPIYQADTLIMVPSATDKLQTNPTQQNNSDNNDNIDNMVNTQMPTLAMNTYLGQLTSETLLNRVIKKLNLDPQQYTTDSLAGAIKATVVQDSNLIEIKVTNADPELASRIANTLCDEAIDLLTEKNQEQMSRSMAFLDKQKKLNDQQLLQAEQKLAQAEKQSGGAAATDTELTQIAQNAATAKTSLDAAQVDMQQAAASIKVLDSELANTPQTITTDKFDASTGTTYKSQDVNPVYTSLQQQLNQTKATLAAKQEAVATLSSQVSSLNSQVNAEGSQSLSQSKLQDDVDRLKKNSDTLAQKTTEAQIAKSIDLGNTNMIVMSPASVPTIPVKPNKKLNVAIAMVLGLIIFTLLAFILEYLDNTLKVPEDVTRELELPVLGTIPMINKETGQSHYGGH